jgi:hypothetical protein
MLPEQLTQLDLWTDTFAALAFIAASAYGYEFFRRKGGDIPHTQASRFVVSIALFPVFWLAYVGAKFAILEFNPNIYYLGNILFGLLALLAMYIGMRHLPIPSDLRAKALAH